MNRIVIISVVMLAALAGAWYMYWERPMASERRDLNKQIWAEQKKLAMYREALTRFNSQLDEFRKVKSKSGRPTIPFSAESEIIGLYESLDSLCHRPGYRLEEITPSLEETVRFLRQWADSDTALSMPIRIKIRADYRSLAALIGTVEQLRDFSEMNDCRLDASERLYPDCMLDMTFTAGLGNRMELLGLE